jgi:hypothetical protein
MSDIATNLAWCAGCPNLLRQNPPRCRAHAERELIDVLVKAAACPEKKHGLPLPVLREPAGPATPPVPSATRPGDLVHLLIKRMGFVATSGCGCAAMQKKMNDWGWWRCAFVHRGEIVEWFVARAADAGVTVTSQTVWGLLRAAIREFAGGRANRASKPD